MLSLRQRLTLWYVMILTLVLLVSGSFWYLSLAHGLRDSVDARLRDVATQSLKTLHSSDELECRVLMHHLSEDLGFGEFIDILDTRTGQSCLSSNLIYSSGLGRLGEYVSAEIDAPEFETFTQIDPPLRIFRTMANEKGSKHFLIQVAATMEAAELALQKLVYILLMSIPLVLAGASFCGWFLARKALDPVDQITQAVRKINASSLNKRLPRIDSNDEIGRLIDTFNSMLSRLEDSFQKISQFSGDASHELRTPLTIIRGEIEVAMRWAKDIDEFKQVLRSNMEEVDLMTRIIEDLLTLSKSEKGNAPLVLQEFNLTDLIQQLHWQTRVLGEEKNISIELKLEVSEEVMIRGDELRLRRLFLNLISNAIKYNNDGGDVCISLGLHDGNAIVHIRDTGFGIPESDLPHIFERFYRVDKARNRAVGGTGLGLAIVKSIVEAHEGSIQVQSSAEQGSDFMVSLPLQGPKDTE